MTKYYVYCPRGFNAESYIYAAESVAGIYLAERMRTAIECSWDAPWRSFRRISEAEARRLCGGGCYIDLDVIAATHSADIATCFRWFSK